MKHWKSLLAATCMAALSAGSAMAEGSVVIGSTGVPRHFNGAIQSGQHVAGEIASAMGTCGSGGAVVGDVVV